LIEPAEAGVPEGSGTAGATPARRRRRRRRSRSSGKPAAVRVGGDESATAEGPAAPAPTEPSEQPAVEGVPGQATRPRTGTRRRRSRRSGAKRSPGTARQAEQAQTPPPAADAVPAEAGETDAVTAPRRRRRRRGGRGRSRSGSAQSATLDKEAAAETSTTPVEEAGPSLEAIPAEEPARPTRSRRRTTPRREPAAPGRAVRAVQEEEATAVGRGRRARGPTRRRRERLPEVVRTADKTMLITEIGERDQIAVLEDRTLVEHYITRSGAHSMVGNIYLGKVQNVLPGMEAAFVDVGRGRNAVLYAGEVSYDEEVDGETPRIEHVLKAGQNVMVQVTKDPMGGKGARLTQEISLPGRYLVLVPDSGVFGISRRLPEKERGRLKDILKKIRPAEHGLIVRTAAEGASAEDLAADLERLIAEWGGIARNAKRGKATRVLYEEPELTVRVVRDAFTGGEFKEMVTDSPELHEKVVAYLRSVAPELISRVHMHE